MQAQRWLTAAQQDKGQQQLQPAVGTHIVELFMLLQTKMITIHSNADPAASLWVSSCCCSTTSRPLQVAGKVMQLCLESYVKIMISGNSQ
jgi:hypothetical protein